MGARKTFEMLEAVSKSNAETIECDRGIINNLKVTQSNKTAGI